MSNKRRMMLSKRHGPGLGGTLTVILGWIYWFLFNLHVFIKIKMPHYQNMHIAYSFYIAKFFYSYWSRILDKIALTNRFFPQGYRLVKLSTPRTFQFVLFLIHGSPSEQSHPIFKNNEQTPSEEIASQVCSSQKSKKWSILAGFEPRNPGPRQKDCSSLHMDLGKVEKKGLEHWNTNKISYRCWWPWQDHHSATVCQWQTNRVIMHPTPAHYPQTTKWWLRDLSSELHCT
jgi:hypothetical protein